MILGTKARYAVMAMVDLAMCDASRPTRLKTLSERQEIPLAYLEQIFSLLRQNSLVTSAKGPGGGYTLARDCSKIVIADIVRAVEETTKITRCSAKAEGGCMGGTARCLTHDLWEGLEDEINDYLSGISLQDVCSRRLRVDARPAMAVIHGEAGLPQ